MMALLLSSVSASAITAGAPPVAGHRYWRLKGYNDGSFNGGALANIEFRAAVSGPNIATGGTASAGSEAFGGLAVNAFNGLTEGAGGMWAGASGAVAAGTSWLAYDFGTNVDIAEFVITARSGGNAEQVWDGWYLEHSDDGITWTYHSHYEDFTAWSGDEARAYTPTAAPVIDAYPVFIESFTTGLDNLMPITLWFPYAGKYAVMLAGASGGGGSTDSTITVTDIGGLTFTQQGFQESQNYGEITAVTVDVPTPGLYNLTYTYITTSSRRSVFTWLVRPETDFSTVVFFGETYNVSSTISVGVKVADQVVAASTGRGGSTSLSGLADVEVLDAVMEGTDISSAYSELVSVDETKTVTLSGIGTEAARYVAGGMVLKDGVSYIELDYAKSHVILGQPPNSLGVKVAKSFVIQGAAADGVSIKQSRTFVILE